jgi:Cu+-exporting ATPase
VFDTRNIRQNSFFAFIYNGLGIPIAAGARFTRSSAGFSARSLPEAAFSSVSVIGNALRLRSLELVAAHDDLVFRRRRDAVRD